MSEKIIKNFIRGIASTLIPTGRLFLWMDKYHLCTGIQKWINGSKLEIVDLITWNKERMGMGYRSGKISEYLIVLQKPPRQRRMEKSLHPRFLDRKRGTKRPFPQEAN